MYTIEKTYDYLKAEKKYKSAIGAQALEKMETQLTTNPTYKQGRIVKMEGADFTYRYRISDFRVVYKVYEETVTILMIDLGPRGSIYKN